jgi:dATP/dGTP diphosphohydrolase
MTPGTKHDEGKDRWDLLPTASVREVVRVLGFGAKKYGDENWRCVEDARRRYYAAAMRHLTTWYYDQEKNDPESGLSHLAHCICCLMFLEELEREG